MDISTISGVAISELIKEPIAALYEQFKGLKSISLAQFENAFQRYCKMTMLRCSYVRTVYSTQKPVEIDEIYVPPRFHVRNDFDTPQSHDLKDIDLIHKFTMCERLIVKGNGGSGKTVFLKKLWLKRFNNPSGRLPILIELRRLNEMQTPDILTLCRSELQADIIFQEAPFETLCERGNFEFILDGFDEITKSKRNDITRQILSIAERFPKCPILVSGREDDRFMAWGPFVTYSVAPLTQQEVVTLIKKIPFEGKIKRDFSDLIDDKYYAQHKSFLSNPLLAVMMLMTYRRNGTVSDKITQFYNDAFETLLSWHDGTKDAFERERSLRRDSIRTVFSTFCLISYYDTVHEFDEATVRKYIVKSLSYHRLEDDVEGVLQDFCETVNLLQKDGLYYVFVHRSFQEYFAAECAMQVVSGKTKHFLEDFVSRRRDTTFRMCFEIHPELVYDFYFEDRISKYTESKFCKSIRSRAPRGFLSTVIQFIELDFSARDGRLVVDRISGQPAEAHEHVELLQLISELHDHDAVPLKFTLLDEMYFSCLSFVQGHVETFGRVKRGASFKVRLHFSNESYFQLSDFTELDSKDARVRRFGENMHNDFKGFIGKTKQKTLLRFRDADRLVQDMIEGRATRKDSIDSVLGLDN